MTQKILTKEEKINFRKKVKLQEVNTFRWEIINHGIKKINAKSYLEIGYGEGRCFNNIECSQKTSVSPNLKDSSSKNKKFIKGNSDDFFNVNKETYDVIFIDGHHSKEFVSRDICNSIKILNKNGIIFVHDLNPTTKEAEEHFILGDGWKSFVELRCTNDNLEMYVIDDDQGVGVIRRGRQKKLNINCKIEYENLEKNRKEWLNLISVNEYLKQ